MFGKLLSELKTSNQVSKIRLKTLRFLVGAAAVGLFLGIVLAASKLMGDAEVHPANQLPAAPKLWIYLLVGPDCYGS